MKTFFYIASQAENGGIALCSIDAAGIISQEAFYPFPGVSWLHRADNKLYALLREPFMQQSGVACYDIFPRFTLAPSGGITPTHGSVAAHLNCIGGKLYCVNYLSGSAVMLPDKMLAFSGSGPVVSRQQTSHPHCIVPIPGRQQLAVTDLGTDKIYICTPELELLYSVTMPAGSGPRHIVFSADGRYAYCSLEISCETAVLKADENGIFKCSAVYGALPLSSQELCSSSAIHLSRDGRQLYVSTRGRGGVCIYDICGDELRQTQFVDFGDKASIRDFNIVGNWLLCADETMHRIYVCVADAPERGTVSCYDIRRPWCVLPV